MRAWRCRAAKRSGFNCSMRRSAASPSLAVPIRSYAAGGAEQVAGVRSPSGFHRRQSSVSSGLSSISFESLFLIITASRVKVAGQYSPFQRTSKSAGWLVAKRVFEPGRGHWRDNAACSCGHHPDPLGRDFAIIRHRGGSDCPPSTVR